MKNKLTRKLMLSAFTLLFAVISLGASTYAWFTISNKAEVETFTADVKSAEGIKIGITDLNTTTKPSTWYTGKLPTEAIKPFYNSESLPEPFQFDALTTTNDNLGEFYKLGANQASTDGYIKFRLWIEAEVDGFISLESLTFTSAGQDKYTIDQEFDISADGDYTANIDEEWIFDVASAARVAFQFGNDKYFYEAPTDPADETETVRNAGNSKGFCDLNKGALAYYNKKTDKEETAPTELLSYTSVTSDTLTENTQQRITHLNANNAIYIDVYVWIEGWDAECLNAIFSQTLGVTFSFDFNPHNHVYDDQNKCVCGDVKTE